MSQMVSATGWRTPDFLYTLRVERNVLGISAHLFVETRSALGPRRSILPVVGVGGTPAAALNRLLRATDVDVFENREVIENFRDNLSPVGVVD